MLDVLRKLLLSHPGAVEDHPFGPEPHVFKIGGRMFALVSLGRPLEITLKLEPWHGHLLRSQHPSVRAGYHMNKDHWNTVVLDQNVLDEELAEWIDESYALVVERLPRKVQRALHARAQSSRAPSTDR
jgi:predicted DNA-binding protein (MmcQ/YjbR family)